MSRGDTMIEKSVLRGLVLEVLQRTPNTQVTSVTNEVERLARERGVFPSREYCEKHRIDYRCYERGELNPLDKTNLLDIVWDLICERVLSPGLDQSNHNFPFFHLTPFGQQYMTQSAPHYYDPGDYVAYIKTLVSGLDPVIEQYVNEALGCFRRQLFFASAVMIGAAAEKAVLLLLEAIGTAMTNQQNKIEVTQLLERSRMPAIYEKIQTTLTPLTESNTIPYSIHQGTNEHLLSMFEMIRVQRNDAVHPTAANVDRIKVLLSLNTMPIALQQIYRLIDWLRNNQI